MYKRQPPSPVLEVSIDSVEFPFLKLPTAVERLVLAVKAPVTTVLPVLSAPITKLAVLEIADALIAALAIDTDNTLSIGMIRRC